MFQRMDDPSSPRGEEKGTEMTEVVAKEQTLTQGDTTSTSSSPSSSSTTSTPSSPSSSLLSSALASLSATLSSPSSSSSPSPSTIATTATTTTAITTTTTTATTTTATTDTTTTTLSFSSSAASSAPTPTFEEGKHKLELQATITGGTVPDAPVEDPYFDDTFGCSMSGGGIRSAAFCSGVLWALMNQGMLPPKKLTSTSIALPRGKIPKFYSCVSGGGYIGASFLWWARCKGGGDPRAWQEEYFGRMRRGIGYYIDFLRPMQAAMDILRIVSFAFFLLCTGFIAFLPSTYILCEMILLPYSGYYNTLRDYLHIADRTVRVSIQGMDIGTLLGTDIAWLLFILLFSGIPFLKVLVVFFREASVVELETVFLTDTHPRKMRCAKMVREMFANLYWYLSNIFSTFAFVVLCDFSAIVDTNGDVDVYHSAIADSLRIVILAIVFSRNPDMIANFFQAQIIIWAYYPPHHFLGKQDDNFDSNYRTFAIICKVLLPFAAVVALFRERTVFEFARYRISKAFFDCPNAEEAMTTRGMLCGARFGVNSPRKLFWTPPPDKVGFYPVYISGTTVNKWMISPVSAELFPLAALVRELEAKFYFKNMPQDFQPRIERILKNGEDRAAKDARANNWILAATATKDDDTAPEFFKKRNSTDRSEILSFTHLAVQAHATASNSAELTAADLKTKFGFDLKQVNELLVWISGNKVGTSRRLSLPQTDAAKRFIGDQNVAFIDAAIKIAREAMMSRYELRDLSVQFEETKMEVAVALRRSLRDLAWRNTTPITAGYDILALSSEGWWERYEAGLNEPIFVLPPATTKTEQTVHNKLDALIGANPDISLSEAMGMSAAVGSLAQEITVKSMAQSQVIFGLHMGRWVNTTSLPWPVQLTCMLVIELLLCLPVLIWGGLDDPFDRTQLNVDTGTNDYNYVVYAGGTATIFLYAAWAFFLPLMKKSKYYPFFPHSRLTATLSGEDAWDHGIPSMLYLSDGGHTENLGLLPLLTRRLKYMVLACGSDEECTALQSAMDQARVKLGVSFREIKADQARRQVKRVSNKELDLKSDIEFFARDALQRILVFEVLYPRAIRSWKKSAGSFAPSTLEEPPQKKGYIFFMQPVDAHPAGYRKGETPGPTDVPLGAACVEELEPNYEPLSGCCCRCCHRFALFRGIGGVFPYHATLFQFFTPTLFDAYHAQGARAMKDALEIVLEHKVDTVRKK